ncbi:MAG: RagB/SusD family nutrient uptake outer membrane protein [Gemmatimonadetes bacterium]|nr:RagB/SusD family nutrient uptake outer membrane protein [Gemmatimonadota bacterium]
MTNQAKMLRIVAVALLLPLGACSDLLQVQSPGRISDADLGTKDAIPGMVTGMQYNLSDAINNNLELTAMLSGELYHGGSYNWADIPRGVIHDDDPYVNGGWSQAQQARWVAEDGINKLKDLLTADEFAKSPYVARAYIYAGYANRILGANWCNSVIDGGPQVANTEHFGRAKDEFTAAIPIAQAAGRTDLVNAAYAGRAQIEVLQSDWGSAAADAAQVPSDFEFYAPIDTEMRNQLWYETHSRPEYTVWGTFLQSHPDDPRAPWSIEYDANGAVAKGANGATDMYRQDKYDNSSSDVALSKGTEMLLVQAEAALASGGGDITAAYGFMNQARAVYGMAALPVAGNLTDAWVDLHYERYATLWIEVRHLEDARRWFAATGPAHDDALADRAVCIPIPQAEKLANTNFHG